MQNLCWHTHDSSLVYSWYECRNLRVKLHVQFAIHYAVESIIYAKPNKV